MNLNGY